MRKYKIAITAAALVLVSGLAWSYTGADFAAEGANFASMENDMIRYQIGSMLSMKKIMPAMSASEGLSYSLDLSCGESVLPLYAAQDAMSGAKMFDDLKSLYVVNGETLFDYNIGLCVSLGPKWRATGNFSWLPSVSYHNGTQDHLKANVNFYRQLFESTFQTFGMYLGAGYGYTSGSVGRTLSLSCDDGTPYAFDGNVLTSWNYHAINLEAFMYRTLFVVNMYARLNYYCLFGQAETTLEGTATSGAVSITAQSTDPVQGIVCSGGIELILGAVKLNLEGGIDPVRQGMFYNAGIRLGM